MGFGIAAGLWGINWRFPSRKEEGGGRSTAAAGRRICYRDREAGLRLAAGERRYFWIHCGGHSAVCCLWEWWLGEEGDKAGVAAAAGFLVLLYFFPFFWGN
jgi:hypothetical protein